MKHNNRTICLAISSMLLLAACGGATNEPDKAPSNTQGEQNPVLPSETAQPINSSKELLADKAFDFLVDRTVKLYFTEFPSQYGKVNFYKQYAYHDQERNVYYPKYETLVASHIASTDFSYSITINPTNEYLVLEWLPMDGLSHETYLLVNLNESSNYSVKF